MAPIPRVEVRRGILSSARELFRARGVRGATMTEIARRAGCTRQMVYKVFFDRRELVLAAIVERIGEIADAAAMVDPARVEAAFTKSFVELSVEVIESLRNDSELAILFGDGSPVTPYEAFWTSELTGRALQFWQPWLDLGRSRGLLRDDLPNRDLADWLHTVYASVVLRGNVPAEQERAMIQRFVITSMAMATVDGARAQ